LGTVLQKPGYILVGGGEKSPDIHLCKPGAAGFIGFRPARKRAQSLNGSMGAFAFSAGITSVHPEMAIFTDFGVGLKF